MNAQLKDLLLSHRVNGRKDAYRQPTRFAIHCKVQKQIPHNRVAKSNLFLAQKMQQPEAP